VQRWNLTLLIQSCASFLIRLKDNSFLCGSARSAVVGVLGKYLRLGVNHVMVVAAEQINKVELARR
jgi:hypothetical protein